MYEFEKKVQIRMCEGVVLESIELIVVRIWTIVIHKTPIIIFCPFDG